MKLKNVMIVVKDIERSKQFYKKLFGLDVVLEQEGNVILMCVLTGKKSSSKEKRRG